MCQSHVFQPQIYNISLHFRFNPLILKAAFALSISCFFYLSFYFWAKRRKSGYIPLTITVKNNSDYYDNVSATGCSENGKSFYAIIQTLLFAKTVSTICGFFIDNHRFKIDKSLSGDILAKDKRGAHSG